MNAIFLAIILVVVVLGLQFLFSKKSRKEIKRLREIFPNRKGIDGVQNYWIEDTSLEFDTSSSNKYIRINPTSAEISEEFRAIVKGTNKYLDSNSETSAEYEILKDIAERISDSEERKIASAISTPLYIGLMGTFVGVIFGIIFLLIGTSGNFTTQAISDFLWGVLIAMTGSFAGLLLTTIDNSWKFKDAKSERDKLKNSYFNFLQTELLPTMENTLAHNIKEFKTHLSAFNQEFSDNIADFSGTIPKITDNMRLQTEFITKFNEINIPELAKANLQIMVKLENSIKIFDAFNDYAVSLQKSFENTDALLKNITQLLDRVSEFEKNINGVGDLVQQSYENYGKLGGAVAANLTELQKRWQLVGEFINKSDDEVKGVAVSYFKEFEGLTQKLQKELSDTFSFSEKDNPFSKLKLLDQVNKNLETISGKLDRPERKEPKTDTQLLDELKTISMELRRMRKSIPPSIFKPKDFFKYVFSKNGHAVEL